MTTLRVFDPSPTSEDEGEGTKETANAITKKRTRCEARLIHKDGTEVPIGFQRGTPETRSLLSLTLNNLGTTITNSRELFQSPLLGALSGEADYYNDLPEVKLRPERWT